MQTQDTDALFEIETLENWQLGANVVEEPGTGGASNSNSTNNSADEP